MSPEEAKAEHEKQARITNAAWRFLATNKEFNRVLVSMQLLYGMHQSSFRSEDGYNSKAAAKRDGNKEIINHMLREAKKAKASMDDDAPPPPPQSTVFEFGKA